MRTYHEWQKLMKVADGASVHPGIGDKWVYRGGASCVSARLSTGN